MLGGLTIHRPVANFLQCTCAKNYENWLEADWVTSTISGLSCFGPPCLSTSTMSTVQSQQVTDLGCQDLY